MQTTRTASAEAERIEEDGMTQMMKRAGAGLAVAVLVGVAFATGAHVSAQGPGPGFGRGRFGPPGGPGGPGVLGAMMLGRLDLTQDQHDRVKQVLDSHKDAQQALGQRAMTAHQALQDAIVSGNVDEATIRARAADVAAVEADQAVARARIYGEVLQILTPDQQSKLKTLQDQRKQRMNQMRTNRAARQGQKR